MIQAEQQERLESAIGNKYQLLCRIGGGGMAQVYLVRHRLHGGLFAVKVLAEYLAQDASIVSRFEQEARMAASLASHPNIVPIFDIGEGDGLHYLVMQFIAGEDLASLVRRVGRVTPAAAANVMAQATEALSCAEAKRIVHRDLKLANMLLDETGRVKLLDFGISKITDIADGLTRPGESLGTPFYMSPEQIRGEGCDIRSDLYSLGVVFFELLSGRRPFESQSATAIQMAHLSSPPPSLLTIDPALPPPCDTIVQKLLAKRPEDRYQSTAALLRDLFAHGANAGPGMLRPVIDPALLAAMQIPVDSARQLPREPAKTAGLATRTMIVTPTPDAPVPQPSAAALEGGAHQESQPGQAEVDPVLPGALPAQGRASRLGVVALVSLAVLLVAAAATGLLLLRSGSSARSHGAVSPQGGGPSAIPAMISDAHGSMLLVPAGAFARGKAGNDEQTVSLPAFYIDATEVSNAEYRRFCQATSHPPPQGPDYETSPDEPVTGVSWNDAVAYAQWAGKRLPTEQEWEKSARGTDGRPFPWGSEPWTAAVPVHLEAVTAEPERRSPYGAYNMAGNAWEWTASPNPAGTREFDDMRKVLGNNNFSRQWYSIKGGSFSPGGSAGFASYLRRGFPSDGRSPWIGFRCARDARPPV